MQKLKHNHFQFQKAATLLRVSEGKIQKAQTLPRQSSNRPGRQQRQENTTPTNILPEPQANAPHAIEM